METLHLDSIVNYSNYKNKTVADIIDKNKSVIMKMIRNGYTFDDEVLLKTNIKRSIRDVKYQNEIVKHDVDSKKYVKDSAPLSVVLKEIMTIGCSQELNN